jgi:hypothetical protein
MLEFGWVRAYRIMPITALYTWSENDEGLEVVVQLKGNKASSADVFGKN